jgi:hypothetical protein
MVAKTSLADDKFYKVKVSRSVVVVGRLQWRPGLEIEATGALIKQLDAKPENQDAINDLTEIVQAG